MTRVNGWIALGSIICAGGAGGLQADSAKDAAAVFDKAADALESRKPAALWLLFDPAMPGYAHLRAETSDLLQVATVESTIDIVKNEGDDSSRTMEVDWQMEIEQQERGVSSTKRHAVVKCRLERHDGPWRIASFAPADLFAPTHAEEAWEDVASAVSALSRPQSRQPTDPTWFLSLFDGKMPGYETLRDGITTLLRRGDVESSIELVHNEGDDGTRNLEVDWRLQVLDDATGIAAIQKQQNVKLKMERQGKHWKVTAVDPLEFFGQ
jgi:hypothetical protein